VRRSKSTKNNNNKGYNLHFESLCLNVLVRCKLVCANQSKEFLLSLSMFQFQILFLLVPVAPVRFFFLGIMYCIELFELSLEILLLIVITKN
jgi:hypothetical protein